MRFYPIVVVALSVAACGRGPATGTRIVVDDAGRSVAVRPPVRRIVSLSPATTELLFAIGAGDRVVGRTQWGTAPAAARTVPVVGEGLRPNVEAIVARRPDLVIAYASPGNEQAVAALGRLGIPTIEFRIDRLEDVARGARLLGPVLGDSAHADSLADRFMAAIDSARTTTDTTGPTVLLLAWTDPPIVIGGTSFQSQVVRLAGGRNVFADIAKPSAEVSLETIAARNPDLVVLTGAADTAWTTRAAWRTVPAVRAGHFVRMAGTAFAWPSFRALEAARELHQALMRWRH
ncbi:MAG TPA: helical backbone metal receptor [Gemmatimonadales bacterium]|nr:helical backbone metal receptor [Gemmatimonadales bacterium]